MFVPSRTTLELRELLETLPVIDCHEHTRGPDSAPGYCEPIQALTMGYVASDLMTAGGEAVLPMLQDPEVPTARKWPVFEPLWRRTEHTAYARVTMRVLRDVYGQEEMSLRSLEAMADHLLDLQDPEVYHGLLERAGVRCRLVDLFDYPVHLDLPLPCLPGDGYMIALPAYHRNTRKWEAIQTTAQMVGRVCTSLEEYLDILREIFGQLRDLGARGFKDQSAYDRQISYRLVPRHEAEALFNRVLDDQRTVLGWPEHRPLDDYLMHACMRFARELDLPVQLHTGHMAGIRNDVNKASATHLRSLLELHREVQFDLFHGNWPFAGEWLFLGKNYPNVALDCCWLHIIDPWYAAQVLAEAVTCVPHGKIHGFGGDHDDTPEYTVAHLGIARDVIAGALGHLVDCGWLEVPQARQVAADWLFNNPNRFFRLGLEPVSV
jgi:hypothetical protein